MENRSKSSAISINGSKNGNQSTVHETKPASPVLQASYPSTVSTVKFSEAPPENILPKKKGGFLITSVKDDGDESADDLDVSHASYSDISYSRTTEVDPDQESTASEDTINIVLQSENPSQNNATQGVGGAARQQHVVPTLDNSKAAQSGSNLATTQVNLQASKQQGIKDGANEGGSKVNNVTSSQSTAKSSNSTAPAKQALRTYKFVKRDTHNPVNRAKFRWGCMDYLDLHSPCYSNITQSASNLKIGNNDQQQHQPVNSVNVNVSVPNSNIVASSSSYTLQHSDSSSSIQRDVVPSHVSTSIANSSIPATQVQHSASSSSINHELDARKPNAGGVKEEVIKGSQVDYSRMEGWDTESLKGISSAPPLNPNELGSEGKDEKEAQRTVRIDNRIEQAMDLVKRHLTLAVRYEIAELCDRVSELQEENWKLKVELEVMRSMIPTEMQLLFPHKLKEYVASNSFKLKKSTTASQQQQQPVPQHLQAAQQMQQQQHQQSNQQAQSQNVYHPNMAKPANVVGAGYGFPIPSSHQQHASTQQLAKSQQQYHQQPPTPVTIQSGGVTAVSGAGLPPTPMVQGMQNTNQPTKVLMVSRDGKQLSYDQLNALVASTMMMGTIDRSGYQLVEHVNGANPVGRQPMHMQQKQPPPQKQAQQQQQVTQQHHMMQPVQTPAQQQHNPPNMHHIQHQQQVLHLAHQQQNHAMQHHSQQQQQQKVPQAAAVVSAGQQHQTKQFQSMPPTQQQQYQVNQIQYQQKPSQIPLTIQSQVAAPTISQSYQTASSSTQKPPSLIQQQQQQITYPSHTQGQYQPMHAVQQQQNSAQQPQYQQPQQQQNQFYQQQHNLRHPVHQQQVVQPHQQQAVPMQHQQQQQQPNLSQQHQPAPQMHSNNNNNQQQLANHVHANRQQQQQAAPAYYPTTGAGSNAVVTSSTTASDAQQHLKQPINNVYNNVQVANVNMSQQHVNQLQQQQQTATGYSSTPMVGGSAGMAQNMSSAPASLPPSTPSIPSPSSGTTGVSVKAVATTPAVVADHVGQAQKNT